MTIGIYGDSFTDINPQDLIDHDIDRLPWPIHLSNRLDQPITYYGLSATSLWWSYKKFLDSFKQYNVIVFSYTNYNRWNTINYRHLSGPNYQGFLAHIFHKDQLNHVLPENRELAKKLIDIHPYLYDDEFNRFVYQTIFDNVNGLCKERNIKLVNLLPFEEVSNNPLVISFANAHGPCITNLQYISNLEYFHSETHELRSPQLSELMLRPDRRHCHVNPHNSRVLATIIKEAMDNNIEYINLIKDPRFSFDIKHLQYLIDEL